MLAHIFGGGQCSRIPSDAAKWLEFKPRTRDGCDSELLSVEELLSFSVASCEI